MNKNITLPFVALIMVLAMVLATVGAVNAASADNEVTTVDTVEVRGTVIELDEDNPGLASNTPAGDQFPGHRWNYSTFAGFWYDLDDNLETETLTILARERDLDEDTLTYKVDRTIGEGSLVYTTHPVFQEYELHEDIPDPDREDLTRMEEEHADSLEQKKGLCVESDNTGGDCGYFIEGWMAEEYIAIDNSADEVCKLLVEFEDDDKKTLATGEEWDLGGGFSLVANQIDLEGDKVWFSLKKDGKELDNEVASTGAGTRQQDRVYTYTADIGTENDIPVFSCYVDAVFRGTDTNVVQVMYVFLIDNDVMEIDTSDTYGAMEVMTASKSEIVLKNDENTIDLDTDTIEPIMGNMYFKTADDDDEEIIRFYPYVEYTIGGVVDPGEEIDTTATPTATEEVGNETVGNETGIGEGEGETGEAVSTATEAPAVETETEAPVEETATPKKTPGFEAIFAIVGLLAIAYLVLRQRD